MNKIKAPAIPARIFNHYFSSFRNSAPDLPTLLNRAGITPNQLDNPNTKIPAEKLSNLIRYCYLAMRNENFGQLERPTPIGQGRLVVLGSFYLDTLLLGLERYLEFRNLARNSVIYTLKTSGHLAEIEIKQIPGHKFVDCGAVDTLFTTLHRMMGWMIGQAIPLHQVQHKSATSAIRDDYRFIYYGAPVLFNQDRNCLTFKRSFLDMPITQTEQGINSYLNRSPLDFFFPLTLYGETTLLIRQVILSHLTEHQTLPTWSLLAESLQCSARTLQRQLKDEGSNYHDLKIQVRRDLAIQHLSRAELSIERIAEKIGYTETSVFVRAFKGWTGITPLQFRKQSFSSG